MGFIVLAVAAGAFLKGVTGMGLPLIAIPVMAPVIGAQRAVVIMAIPTFVTNVVLLWQNRGHSDDKVPLRALAWTGAVGAVAGTALLTSLNDRVLGLVLGVIVLGSLGLLVARPSWSLDESRGRVLAAPLGLSTGALQGVTGASGPLVAVFLHGFRLERRSYVYALTVVLQVHAGVQVCALIVLGAYDWQLLAQSAATVVPAVAFLRLGTAAGRRLSPRTFEVLVLILLAVAGLKLLFDGLRT